MLELSGTGTKTQGIHKKETDEELVILIFVLYRLCFPAHQGKDAGGTSLEIKYLSPSLVVVLVAGLLPR